MRFGKVKRVMAVVMACLCVVGTVAVSGNVVKAKTMKRITHNRISKTELTMYPNMVRQLKVMSVGKKVKWSSTDPKMVSILGSTGKEQQTVTIRTKGKTGTCKVKAKVAGKTYTCKVTVKKDTNVSRVKLVKVKKTSKSVQIKVKICNRSGKTYWYWHPYTVEKFVNGKWKKVAPSDDIVFTAEAIRIPAHSTMEQSYAVSAGGGVKQFTKGVYRLKASVVGMKYNYVLFSL